MKKLLLIFLLNLLLSPVLLFSQNEIRYWMFDRIGLDFGSGNPVLLITGMKSFECTSAICDGQGNLLFYTNGGTWTNPSGPGAIGAVYDANHQLMPNGWLVDTAGCYSADQGVIILKDPGNADEYYIFTQDCAEAIPNKGTRYSKVDMSLNGGLGAVTEVGVELIPPSGVGGIFSTLPEYLAALPGKNTGEYWILAFKGDSLCRVHVDAQGVSSYQCQGLYIRNRMVVSPRGDQIIIGSILYQFNHFSGTISKPIPLPLGFYYEFSPNGRIIYTITSNNAAISGLYQMNQDDPIFPYDTFSIAKEMSGIPLLAPNCKIYLIPTVTSPNIDIVRGVINFPNTPGIDCGFIDTIYASVFGSVANETFSGKPAYYKPYAFSEQCPIPPPPEYVPDFNFPVGVQNSEDIKNHTSPNQIEIQIPSHDGVEDEPGVKDDGD